MFLPLAAAIMLPAVASAQESGKDIEITAKHVRINVNKGNDKYRAGNYSEAETFYRQALQEDPSSEVAQFNLALALLRQAPSSALSPEFFNPNAGEKKPDPVSDAYKYFSNVTKAHPNGDTQLVLNSFYNLGNIAFNSASQFVTTNRQQAMDLYRESIDMYKSVLRKEPDDIKARQNLRVAQLKLKELEGQQDKNQDQNQQQQQQKQEEQQKQENQQQPQPQPQPQQQQPQQKKDENAEQILQAARKQEEQTRKDVEERRKVYVRPAGKPW